MSGESGAGKTEATKHIVRHLVQVGGSEVPSLERKVIEVSDESHYVFYGYFLTFILDSQIGYNQFLYKKANKI